MAHAPVHVKPDRKPGQIPKAELRKIKQRVAALRKKGHDLWTDDEVEREGWRLESGAPPTAHPAEAVGMNSLVPKARQQGDWDCGLACVHMGARPSSHLYAHRPRHPHQVSHSRQ